MSLDVAMRKPYQIAAQSGTNNSMILHVTRVQKGVIFTPLPPQKQTKSDYTKFVSVPSFYLHQVDYHDLLKFITRVTFIVNG